MYQGKTALITGASSGIGRAMATQLADKGSHLILVARSTDALEALKTDIAGKHPEIQVTVISTDLAQPGSARALFEQTQTAGLVVEILINNAGYGMQNNFLDVPLEEHTNMLQLNMITLTELTHLYATEMKQRRSGAIMVIASIGGYTPCADFATYAASKAYVLSLGEALHHDLKPFGITVSAVSPGPVRTGFSDRAGQNLNKVGEAALMSADKCAQIALKTLQQHKQSQITGVSNKMAMAGLALLPRKIKPILSKQFLMMGQH